VEPAVEDEPAVEVEPAEPAAEEEPAVEEEPPVEPAELPVEEEPPVEPTEPATLPAEKPAVELGESPAEHPTTSRAFRNEAPEDGANVENNQLGLSELAKLLLTL
jgi:hypothetical protein